MLCGTWASCVALVAKNLHTNAGDLRDAGSIPESGRSPGGSPGGLGNPLQYSCLENPMDKGAWPATGHGVRESRTALKQLSTHVLDPHLERKLLGLERMHTYGTNCFSNSDLKTNLENFKYNLQ